MIRTLPATFISRPVHDWLAAKHSTRLHVLSSTPRACNLLASDGEIIVLVTPEVGNGPLNVVIPAPAGLPAGIDRAAIAWLSGALLNVGPLTIDLEHASLWEPCPNWEAARTRAEIHVNLGQLLAYVVNEIVPATTTLLALLGANEPAGYPGWAAIRPALAALRAGWQGDGDQLEAGTRSLAGLGPGLTPAGDDFIMGMMLQAWLSHPHPDVLCRRLLNLAAPRTTLLSATWLRAAARGACSESWHRLVAALSAPLNDRAAWAHIVHGVLAHGASSGADSLAGFLCLSPAALSAATREKAG